MLVNYLTAYADTARVQYKLLINLNEEVPMATNSGKSKRGFAAMDPKKQREIARKGGQASHGGGRRRTNLT